MRAEEQLDTDFVPTKRTLPPLMKKVLPDLTKWTIKVMKTAHNTDYALNCYPKNLTKNFVFLRSAGTAGRFSIFAQLLALNQRAQPFL